MPQNAPIVINDGADTPVSHTFNPMKLDGNSALYRENGLAGVPTNGQPTVMLSLKQVGQTYQANIASQVPVMEQASGGNASGYIAAPRVAYYSMLNTKCNLPERGTSTERQVHLGLHVNLLQNDLVESLVQSLEQPY